MWQANKLGKSLQKGRKIKKSQFHVQKHYIFSRLEIVCLLMWPTPVNLITGLDVWQMFCGKTDLNGDHANRMDIWAITEHLWGGFVAVQHDSIVPTRTYLVTWCWWGSPILGQHHVWYWELQHVALMQRWMACVLIWHRRRSIIYAD